MVLLTDFASQTDEEFKTKMPLKN